MPPERWFEQFLERSQAQIAGMRPNLLIASNFLPGRPPNDPADRIIAATARDLEATLITRDRHLLHYASQGYLRAIAC
jgi:PIN domain nuclease of toxin-antitoxin system